jgi:hypothetical protein
MPSGNNALVALLLTPARGRLLDRRGLHAGQEVARLRRGKREQEAAAASVSESFGLRP